MRARKEVVMATMGRAKRFVRYEEGLLFTVWESVSSNNWPMRLRQCTRWIRSH